MDTMEYIKFGTWWIVSSGNYDGWGKTKAKALENLRIQLYENGLGSSEGTGVYDETKSSPCGRESETLKNI